MGFRALIASAGAGLRRRRWLWLGVFGALLVAWPIFVHEVFFVYIATLMLLYTIGAASLHLVLRTGHLSLCHAAFMGLGGYTSALLTTRLGWPFALAFLASGLMPAAVALVVGPIVLRLRGVYFVLITFTLGEVVRLVLNEWKSLTGGADGIFRIPPPSPFLVDKRAYYYFALAMAAVCVGVIARILAAQTGRYIDAIRESERLAQSSGVPILRFKVMVFAIACGFVGFQGSLLAHFITFVAPGSYTFNESLNLLVGDRRMGACRAAHRGGVPDGAARAPSRLGRASAGALRRRAHARDAVRARRADRDRPAPALARAIMRRDGA
jgi:branched-chain amino acid transport system permease protein